MTTHTAETMDDARRARDDLANRIEELSVLAGLMARAREGNDAYYEEHALPLLEMLERGLREAVDAVFDLPVGTVTAPEPEAEAA